MIKAVLFDLDGVLVDACDFHYYALNKALGFNLSREEHETKYNGLSTRKKLEILANEGRISPEDIDNIWKLKQKYTQEHIENLSLDHVKVAMLLTLRRQYIDTVCVTNAIRETAELMLKKTGQYDLISFIVSNEDCQKNKPHPDPYLFALDKLELAPTDVMIVEDSEVGIQSASQVTTNVLKVRDSYDVDTVNILKAIRNFNEYSSADGG